MIDHIELSKMDLLGPGRAVLDECDKYAEWMDHLPATFYLFENQISTIARSIRGAIRRGPKPDSLTCDQWNTYIMEEAAFALPWKYKGVPVQAQMGRYQAA